MTSQKFISLSIAALIGTAMLMALGVWQLQRMEWKQGLIAKIEARAQAAPVDLSEVPATPGANIDDVRFLRVRLEGRYRHRDEIHIYSIQNKQTGWRIITLLETTEGDVVPVIRGFVPEQFKTPRTRRAGQVEGSISIVGRIRSGETQPPFVPDNDNRANEWYWRDLAAFQAGVKRTMGKDMLPFFLELETRDHTAEWPKPQPKTASDLHNRHFGYALTWFGLAAVLVAIYGALFRDRMKT